jgi:hypothetical protein
MPLFRVRRETVHKVLTGSDRGSHEPSRWVNVARLPAIYQRRCTLEPPLSYFSDSFHAKFAEPRSGGPTLRGAIARRAETCPTSQSPPRAARMAADGHGRVRVSGARRWGASRERGDTWSSARITSTGDDPARPTRSGWSVSWSDSVTR